MLLFQDSGDIRFIVDGCVIYAHKAVLKIRSDYFQKMFENNWKESTDSEWATLLWLHFIILEFQRITCISFYGLANRGVFQITDFPYQSFRTFLLYLYTERVEPPLRNSEEAIGNYRLIKLFSTDSCNWFSIRKLFHSTELFKLADYNGEEDLKQRCEQQLKLLTNEDNVCDLYSIAVQYNVEVTFANESDFSGQVQFHAI